MAGDSLYKPRDSHFRRGVEELDRLRSLADTLLASSYNNGSGIVIPLYDNPLMNDGDVSFMADKVRDLTGTPVPREQIAGVTTLFIPTASVRYYASRPREEERPVQPPEPAGKHVALVTMRSTAPALRDTSVSDEWADLAAKIADGYDDFARKGIRIPSYSRRVFIDRDSEPELAAAVEAKQAALIESGKAGGMDIRIFAERVEISKDILGKAGRSISSARAKK